MTMTPDADLVDLEFDLPDPPAKVWRALVDPAIVDRWMGADAAGNRAADAPVDAEPGRRVSYRWQDPQAPDGIVTFSIAENAIGGTRLRIVHSAASVGRCAPRAVNDNAALALAA